MVRRAWLETAQTSPPSKYCIDKRSPPANRSHTRCEVLEEVHADAVYTVKGNLIARLMDGDTETETRRVSELRAADHVLSPFSSVCTSGTSAFLFLTSHPGCVSIPPGQSRDGTNVRSRRASPLGVQAVSHLAILAVFNWSGRGAGWAAAARA